MSRKKKLEKEDIRAICEWIEEQNRKVTWPSIVEICPELTGKEFTRIALRKPAIVEKRKEKNERLELVGMAESGDLPSKRDREKELRIRARLLQQQNDRLIDQITRWIGNAARLSISFGELDRELPPATRPTREQHERRARNIEDEARMRVERAKEKERHMDAKRATKKAKAGAAGTKAATKSERSKNERAVARTAVASPTHLAVPGNPASPTASV